MELEEVAGRVAALLVERGQTIAVAESSAGGLISAALLACPGASRYFLGGAVVYTASARAGLLGITAEDLVGMRPATSANPSSSHPVTPPIIFFTGRPRCARRSAALSAPLQWGPAQ